MKKVSIIQPNLPAERATEQDEYCSSDVRVLGFPKYLFSTRTKLSRKLFQDEELSLSVTVDLLTGTVKTNDIYPKLESRELTSTSLLNPRLDKHIAGKKARSHVRRQVSRQYTTFTTPDIRTIEKDIAFKIFWAVPIMNSSTVSLIDSITGEVTARNIELENQSEEGSQSAVDRSSN
jgi:hypothetical protein